MNAACTSSAFHPAGTSGAKFLPAFQAALKRNQTGDETEDEEVKRGCMSGSHFDESSVGSASTFSSEMGDRTTPESVNESTLVKFVDRCNAKSLRCTVSKPMATTSPRGHFGRFRSCDEQNSKAQGVPVDVSAVATSSDQDWESLDDDNESFVSDVSMKQVDEDEELESELGDDDFVEAVVEGQENDPIAAILNAIKEEPEYSESSERLIGVSHDCNEPVVSPRPKRVLSFNGLSTLSVDGNPGSPKRVKALPSPVLFSSLSKDPDEVTKGFVLVPSKREAPETPSIEDEDLDLQLGEELREKQESRVSGDKTPIPLLTPPQSPVTVQMNGGITTVCEWPSNLAVDSAMVAVSELRPLSPASLEDLEVRGCMLDSVMLLLSPKVRTVSVGTHCG